MYQLMINRKNSKKGFTLVEVIVVLVILAILAAIMIPAMTGWIDKARQKGVVVEARTAYLAAQTLAAEDYGAKNTGWKTSFTDGEINELAQLQGRKGIVTKCTADKGVITSFIYTGAGTTCTWTNGVLVVTETAA